MQSHKQNLDIKASTQAPEADANAGRSGSSRRERHRAETRERLFNAAMLLLSKLPFDAVTIEHITHAAEVSKGTFFNYFASKEAVVAYRYERQRQQLTPLLRNVSATRTPAFAPLEAEASTSFPVPANASPAVASTPIWTQMMSITHLLAERDAHSKPLARNLLALPLVNETVRVASQAMRGQLRAVLEGLIRQGQASGEIRTDTAADILADYLVGVYFSSLARWVQYDSTQTLQGVVDQTYLLVWQGLQGEQATP